MHLHDDQTFYVSPAMEIDRHVWRLRIERGASGLVTRYEFQDISGGFWCRSQSWPRYDINDTYLGLPRGLARLYEREKPALIKFGLAAAPTPSAQLRLGL